MIRRIVLTAFTIGVTLFSGISAFAGEWKQNATGWWYQNEDGTNPASSWKNIDGRWY